MKFSTVSNIGKVRSENQDYFGNTNIDNKYFFIVADGMGGYKGGELASRLASKYFIEFIENNNLDDYESIIDFQVAAIRYANLKIYDLSKSHQEYSNMGTTVVCLCLDYENKVFHVSHIGDSRAYIFSKGALRQITRDHSLVNDLIDSGSLTESEAKSFINKNAITRAVGISKNLKADSISFEMKNEDIILLVTDGLTNEVSDKEIETIISQNGSADQISTNLVDLAIKKGGHDNITVTTVLI